jgi:hypothetical protein
MALFWEVIDEKRERLLDRLASNDVIVVEDQDHLTLACQRVRSRVESEKPRHVRADESGTW